MPTHKHIRSSTANKRPTTAIADGQIALNTNAASPGLFFKDSAGATLIKVGPVHVGTTAPNATPAAGGSSGNSTGEVWLDTSLTPTGVKIWSGSAWVNATPIGSTTVQGLLELATNAETQTGSDTTRAVTPAALQSKMSDSATTSSTTTIASSTAVKTAYDLANAALPKSGGTVTGALEIGTTGSLVFEGATADGFETTLAVVNPTADRTIALPNVTGTIVTTGDTGTVSSNMLAGSIALSKLATGALPSSLTVNSSNIVDGSIVNADISGSAAIAHSKLASITSGRVLLGNSSNVPTATALSGDVTVSNTGVTSISAGVITNADISGTAGIADTKLATISTAGKVADSALPSSISSNITGNAATATKLSSTRTFALTGDVTGSATVDLTSGVSISTSIAAGKITNADISGSAAIADTKLATISTGGKVSGSAITSGSISTTGNLTISNSVPSIFLIDSDYTSTHNNTLLSRNAENFSITTRNSSGTFVSTDYKLTVNNNGATDHIWQIADGEAARIDSTKKFLFGRTSGIDVNNAANLGASINGNSASSIGQAIFAANTSVPLYLCRRGNDGQLVNFVQGSTTEGTINVSGTTVSYNGAHLSRWSQLSGVNGRIDILRGTVLSNLDEMCIWGDEANEQLNRMKVSDIIADKNVAGVFQSWDDDDDVYTNDFYCAMTGDFIIRISANVTVNRGDLLMSAGDGTAKPQDDDLVRSYTVAKVTSTKKTCTYGDGSYCVPCVLMAC